MGHLPLGAGRWVSVLHLSSISIDTPVHESLNNVVASHNDRIDQIMSK